MADMEAFGARDAEVLKKKPTDPNAPYGGGVADRGTGPVGPAGPMESMGGGSVDYQTMKAPATDAGSAGLGPMTMNPATGMAGHASAPAPAGGEMTPQQAAAAGLGWVDKNNPNYGKPGFVGSASAAPSAPSTPAGGSSDFPSLPPGATPPPGYFDPVSGKSAPMSPAAGPAAPGAPAAPTPAATPAAPGAPAAPAAPPATIADSFKQALIGKLNGAGPIDANNPAIKGAIDANHLSEQRGFENQRNLLAERAAKDGTDASGGFDTGLTGLAEDRAMREGKYSGDAVMHLQDQQNDNIMRALGIGGAAYEGEQNRSFQGGENQKGRDLQSIMQDKSLSMQDKIAQLDAALRGRGIDQQGRLGEAGINADLLRTLLGADYNNRALNQQGAQFGAGLDAQTIMGLLGGLA